MSLSILWTDEAKETFDIIVNFLENNWGSTSAKKFIEVTLQKNNPYFRPTLFI